MWPARASRRNPRWQALSSALCSGCSLGSNAIDGAFPLLVKSPALVRVRHEPAPLVPRTFAQAAGHSRYARSYRRWRGDWHFFRVHSAVWPQDVVSDFCCLADAQQHSRGGACRDLARHCPAHHAGDLSLGIRRGFLAAEPTAPLASVVAQGALGRAQVAELGHHLHHRPTVIAWVISLRDAPRAVGVCAYENDCRAAPAQEAGTGARSRPATATALTRHRAPQPQPTGTPIKCKQASLLA